MRLSTIKGDRGYYAWKKAARLGACAKVMLDGKEINECHTADTKRGYVLVTKHNESGAVQLSKDRSRILMEMKRGKVSIELMRNAWK